MLGEGHIGFGVPPGEKICTRHVPEQNVSALLAQAFYMRVNDDDRTVAAMDMLVPRVGELMGGSQREERAEVRSCPDQVDEQNMGGDADSSGFCNTGCGTLIYYPLAKHLKSILISVATKRSIYMV